MMIALFNQTTLPIMKNIISFILVALSLFMFGCASMDSQQEPRAEAGQSSFSDNGDTRDSRDRRTAFEGKTGSGLLMERYQTGEIAGFRD